MSPSFQCIYVGFYVKCVERRIAPQIERMMGMALYGALARREPLRAKLLADGDHVRNAAREIRAHFNDVAPGCPYRRAAGERGFENVPERRHILRVQMLIERGVHVVRTRGALGVDIDSLLVSQPDTGEQAMEICEALVRSGAIDAIVVDSVAAMVPKAEIEGEMGDSHVGLQARLMSQALRKLTGIIGKTNTVCIFINQLREKVGVMYGNPEVTTGGRALKYYSSVRIDVRRIEGLKDASGSFIGNRTRAKIVKNKVAPPFREAEFDIMFGEGISKLGEMIDLGAKLGIVQKSGAWFNYGDIRLGQGRDNAKLYLKEHPDVAAEIEKQVRENADRLLAAGKKGTVKPLEKPAVTPVAAEDAPAAPMADAPKTTGSEMDLDIMVDE